MKKFFRNNGLSAVLFLLFAASLGGQYFTGLAEYNGDREEHGATSVGYLEYLGEGHFVEAVFENWESEFLQMAMYVLLTVALFQKGSSESKDPDKEERVDKIAAAAAAKNPKSPWPVRRGGIALKFYQNSLSIALIALFVVSLVIHAAGGAVEYSREQIAHGMPSVTTAEYLATSRFWFESFQNWQSEFLSIGVMVVFTIFLRQKGSPESKAVDASHDKTGAG